MGANHVLVVRYAAAGIILVITVLTLMRYLQYNKARIAAMSAQMRELEKANRSLKVFMRELTHEIRTPLNAIYSIAQLKLMDAPDNPYNEQLHYACHNVLSIINNVQDRSKIEAGRPDEVIRELFDVRSWVQEVCSIYQYLAGARCVQLKVDIAPQLPAPMYEDKTCLTKIANNIIGNAIKFSPRNTVVTVSISQAGGQWQIAVKDQGAGISREKLVTLFDEFTRERINFAEGTGLGLNIAQKLAYLLQGNIQVFSEPGKGACFIICLPVQECKNIPPAAGHTGYTDDLIFSGRRLLLIEDDPMSRQYLQRYLQSRGFEVVAAEDGMEGLYRASCDSFDIIISDMGLPGIGGRELLAHLKANRYLSHIPVIITSADTDIRDEALQAGAAGCLIKPVDFKLLHKVLKAAILQAALAPETRA
jgi:CheY-like chemotaxis protein/nitrogen-specific signal transduction histidine kinase